MIFDKELMFSEQQELAASADATNILDIGPAKVGASNLRLVLALAPGASGSGLLNVELKTADAVTSGGDLDSGSSRSLASYTVTGSAAAKGGIVVDACLPASTARYLKARYNISGSITGLVATSGLVLDCETH